MEVLSIVEKEGQRPFSGQNKQAEQLLTGHGEPWRGPEKLGKGPD